MIKDLSQHLQDVDAVQQAMRTAYHAQSMVCRVKPPGQLPHSIQRQPVKGPTIPLHVLNGILGLEEGCVWVEPGVTMRQLVDWTLPQGLIPPVVAEFQEITVGGAVMGAALESASFREGQFCDCCTDYALILADGSKVRTSAQDNPLLHSAVSGSYGSLATLVAARVRLQPAKRYVRLSYQVIHRLDEISGAIDRVCESSPDYVDGIILDANHTLLMTGYLTDVADGPVCCFSRPWHPWFIQHVLTKVDAPSDDWIPLRDYLFRYDRGAFWMGQYCTSARAVLRFLFSWKLQAPDLHEDILRYSRTLSPSLPLRTLLGPRLSSCSLYRTLHQIPRETLVNTFHIQDFYIPTTALSSFLRHLQEHVQIYPVWLCPVKGASNDQFLSPHHLASEGRVSKPDFVNVGVYGIPANGRAVPDVARELEELTHALGGRKMLYAVNSIPEELFWQIYDRERYDSLREDLHTCDILPDVYSKTHRW